MPISHVSSLGSVDQTILSGIARQTTYSYTLHPNKLVASSVLDDPLEGSGDSLSASFSEKGELLAVKNSLGHSTSYGSYNNLGRPGTKTEPNGLTIEYSYDSRGRVLTERRSTSDGRNSNRNWQYNAGLLLRSSEVTGVTNNYFYNAARDLIGEFIKNSDGTYDSKELTLDAASNVTGFTVSRDNYPANTTIIGKITNVDADADFNYTIHGWACSTGYESPVNVHIYFNGAAGTGTFFTEVTASEPSEAGAIASCAITSTAHNFSLPLTIDQRRTYANQPIYIHGISPVGKDNALLANSGSLVVPAVVDSITAEIIGWTHPDHMVSGESTTITLQIRNTGNTTWQPGETYLAWGTTINSLSDSKALASSVPPGQIATFTWNWTAPELSTSTQSFNFAASMATSGSTWGPHTSTSITVEDLSGNCDGTRCEVPMVLPVE
ncbi:hypothetical protein XaplCFBP3122_20800 [Xanthomonas arboricola pv. populi]|uniref:Uncharacterized protein n=1 Tax=Xanthomonas arboricola pv. populi TaxID=487823 RepID=A0A2S6YYZ6_9XANT|nr:hypothetical protein XaplCFBP3122_20800 [Xanthomonas arboricola pv. populi]